MGIADPFGGYLACGWWVETDPFGGDLSTGWRAYTDRLGGDLAYGWWVVTDQLGRGGGVSQLGGGHILIVWVRRCLSLLEGGYRKISKKVYGKHRRSLRSPNARQT